MKNTLTLFSKGCLLVTIAICSFFSANAQREVFSKIEVRDGRLYFPNEEYVKECYQTLDQQLKKFYKEKVVSEKRETEETDSDEFFDDEIPLKEFEEGLKFISLRTDFLKKRFEVLERNGDPARELKSPRVDDVMATFLNSDGVMQVDDKIIGLVNGFAIKISVENSEIIRKIKEGANPQDFGPEVVEILNPPCNAEFTYSGNTNLGTKLNFIYSGTNVQGQTYYWTFGDGNTSTDQNPTYQYSKSGVYTVMVKVTNGETNCTSSKTLTIKTSDCVANFTYSGNNTGLVLSFTYSGTIQASYNPTFKWDFGDGATSTDKDPNHTYTSAGDYDVQLTVTVNGQSCTTKEKVSINKKCNAKFTWQANGVKGSICFSDKSNANNGSITSWEWDFGDGEKSTDKNPCHIYTCDLQPKVTLKIKTSAGCESSFTENISVASFTCCDPRPSAESYLYSTDKSDRVEYEMWHHEPVFDWNNYAAVTRIWYDKWSTKKKKYKNACGKLEINHSGKVYTKDGAACACKIVHDITNYDIDPDGHRLTCWSSVTTEEIKAKYGEPWDATITLNGTVLGTIKINVGCNP